MCTPASAAVNARALRFARGMEPGHRAELLERFARERYFVGQGGKGVAALKEALAIYRDSGDLVGQGRTLCQLGKQISLTGDLAASRAALHQAVAVLKQVPPGPELARAYASLSTYYGLSDDTEALRWGNKAIALAEETGCTDVLIYALNAVGTQELGRGDRRGLAKLEKSRELAEQTADEPGTGRAYGNLAVALTARREWVLADRYLEPGIAYCRERGLEGWLSWLTVLKAESDLARGDWDDAADAAETIGAETERALALEMASVPWYAGELACWRRRAGLPAEGAEDPGLLAEPYRLEITGDALAAARWWQDRNCAYDAALTLANCGDTGALRHSLSEFRKLGTRPAASIVARRLRTLGERGLPRGPRPETAANPVGLTGRELDVLSLLAAGLRNAEIAARLVVSARTVEHHVSAILRKLGAPTRGAAITEAARLGLVDFTRSARPVAPA